MESQTGNTVHFSIKEKSYIGFHVSWHTSSSVRVDVETPAEATLDVRVGDGSIDAGGLRLAVEGSDLKSDSGHSLHGKLDGGGATLSIHTSDGSIKLTRS